MSIDLILLVAAAICFALATMGVAVSKISFLPLGLLLWVLSVIIE